jgi:hypothetical protein
MDYQSFYRKLDGYYPLGSALKAYLNVALREIDLTDNEPIDTAHWRDFPCSFVYSGTLKTKLESKLDPGRSVLYLHFEGLMLPHFLEKNYEDFNLYTIPIGRTKLLSVPSGHLQNLYRLFPEFHKLIDKINLDYFSELLHLAFDIKNLKAEDRLAALLKVHPNIFQLASSKDIADSIGMHAHTLSSLKNKYFNK